MRKLDACFFESFRRQCCNAVTFLPHDQHKDVNAAYKLLY